MKDNLFIVDLTEPWPYETSLIRVGPKDLKNWFRCAKCGLILEKQHIRNFCPYCGGRYKNRAKGLAAWE